MPRRLKAAPAENHERWLVSYADFITLLFAFFVVMFASSQTDHKRAQQISDSVKKALSEDRVKAAVQSVLGGTVNDKGKGNAMLRGPGGSTKEKDKEKDTPPPPDPIEAPRVAELLQSYDLLTGALKAEIETGKLQIHMEQRGLVISFRQAATFPSAGDEITPGAIDSIRKVAVTLDKIPNPIRLEGHTDSLPINNSRFRSNWQLSAARSIAMLEVLSSQFHISKRRMSFGGYGDAAPIDTNETEAGRARNRRVDLVILNETGMAAEPTMTHAGATKPPEIPSATAKEGAAKTGAAKTGAASAEAKPRPATATATANPRKRPSPTDHR